jgi:hypothetical protein
MLTAYLTVAIIRLNVSFQEIAVLSVSFTLIAFITILVFLKGQTKPPDSQTFHTLVAISLKFLLELVLALLWFIVAKKTSMQSVLIFFVLYLTLTLFTIRVVVKTLKDKAL